MKTIRHLSALCLTLSLFAGCDAPDDGHEDATIEDGGKADGFNVPTDFPGTDTHCQGVFRNCDSAAGFDEMRWGSLGARVDDSARAGDTIEVRAFIESDDLDRVRTRLYYAVESVGSLAEAEQIGVVRATGTRTGFGGNGMEVRVIADVQDSMVEGGRLDGVFYLAFSGADGIIRAIDADVQ